MYLRVQEHPLSVRPVKKLKPLPILRKGEEMADRNNRKEEFIDALAEYLTRDLGERSIRLQMGNSEAREWAKLYGLAGLCRYPTKQEAIKKLKELL